MRQSMRCARRAYTGVCLMQYRKLISGKLNCCAFVSIPNSLDVGGWKFLVIMIGRKPTCWKCCEIGDLGPSCPERRPLEFHLNATKTPLQLMLLVSPHLQQACSQLGPVTKRPWFGLFWGLHFLRQCGFGERSRGMGSHGQSQRKYPSYRTSVL